LASREVGSRYFKLLVGSRDDSAFDVHCHHIPARKTGDDTALHTSASRPLKDCPTNYPKGLIAKMWTNNPCSTFSLFSRTAQLGETTARVAETRDIILYQGNSPALERKRKAKGNTKFPPCMRHMK
jgi:hypothetical protein